MRRFAAAALGVAAVLLATPSCADPPPAPGTVVFDGQSLNNTPEEGLTFPVQVMRGRSEDWVNTAQNGLSWTRLAASADRRVFRHATEGHDTLVMNGGTSDIAEGDTGESLYAEEVAYAGAARRAGFERVIILTLPPSAFFTAPQDAEREAHNALLLEDPDGAFDAVVDVASLVPLGHGFYLDGIHWSEAGARKAAQAVREVL